MLYKYPSFMNGLIYVPLFDYNKCRHICGVSILN